jgi:hypothetical protein
MIFSSASFAIYTNFVFSTFRRSAESTLGTNLSIESRPAARSKQLMPRKSAIRNWVISVLDKP